MVQDESEYRSFVWVFAILLIVVYPVAICSPKVFAGISVSPWAHYSSAGSIFFGVWFLAAAMQLTTHQKRAVSSSQPWLGMEIALLYVPVIIYKGTKEFLGKWAQ